MEAQLAACSDSTRWTAELARAWWSKNSELLEDADSAGLLGPHDPTIIGSLGVTV